MNIGLREFTFDGVYPPKSRSNDIFRLSVRPLIVDFINGYSATALVYGQTGSGKSFTMFGGEDIEKVGLDCCSDGVIPRACKEIISAVYQRREQYSFSAQLYVSYVEIFGDYVTDLLRFGQRCGQSKVASHKFVLSGAAEVIYYTIISMHIHIYIHILKKMLRLKKVLYEKMYTCHQYILVIFMILHSKSIYQCQHESLI